MRKISFNLETVCIKVGKRHYDFLHGLGRGNKSIALRILLDEVMVNPELKKRIRKALKDTRKIIE